ncbi:MAG: DUF4345 domain-containing protein [Anaerolineales bacterium]|uniref:DUF4345 domain-containing protein n=1 Tax=Candidatus Villigracilis vicinus TaxID=3140679 RepID=UPI003134EEC7|nr:DUF4345 domain-containing protein [Anaerolineales bacterium]MBK9778562.1 DUF4345 domain-containing protein [Anaerolineales bacterium]
MTRKLLQSFLVVLGLIPILTGMLTMLGIHDPILSSLNLPASALLDSELRFFGGLWLGLGLTVLATVRNLERHFELYRVLWLMIFLGGVGRLLSIFVIGLPPVPFIAFTMLEIIGAPLFLYWHWLLVKQ